MHQLRLLRAPLETEERFKQARHSQLCHCEALHRCAWYHPQHLHFRPWLMCHLAPWQLGERRQRHSYCCLLLAGSSLVCRQVCCIDNKAGANISAMCVPGLSGLSWWAPASFARGNGLCLHLHQSFLTIIKYENQAPRMLQDCCMLCSASGFLMT